MKFNTSHYFVLILILLLGCFFTSCRENNRVDSLLLQANALIETQPDSVLALLQPVGKNTRQWSKAQQANYNLLLVRAKTRTSLDISGDSTAMRESADYFSSQKDAENAARAYFYQNRIYQGNNNPEAAAKSNLKAIEYIQQSGKNKDLAGFIYIDMGKLYQEQGNYVKAMENYRLAQQCFFEINDKENVNYTYKHIGSVYLHMVPQQADSAISSYQQALDYALSVKDSFETAVLYKNISLAYGEKGDTKNEKTHMLKALNYSKEDDILAIVQRMLAEIYANAHQVDSAVYYMKELMANPTAQIQVDDRYYNQIMLYNMYKRSGNYLLALAHYEKARLLADSIQRNKVDQSVLEIQQKYNKEALENRYARMQVHRLTLIVIIIIILLLTAIAIYFFLSKMKSRRIELLEAQESLSTLNQMLTAHQKQQEALASTLQESRERLKAFLVEKLDITQKVAQLNIVPTGNNDLFMKRYQNVFGKNLMDELGWENLYALINELYNGFADKIKKNYPNLSDKELQMCCFIRAGFQHEEMAVLLNYTQNTVRVKKTRLWQKLEFANYGSFLSTIMEV